MSYRIKELPDGRKIREWYYDRGLRKERERAGKEKVRKLPDGRETREIFYANGQLQMRINFKGEALDGLWEEWDENGQQMFRMNFKKNKRDGLREEWDEDGRLLTLEAYKDGNRCPIDEYVTITYKQQ